MTSEVRQERGSEGRSVARRHVRRGLATLLVSGLASACTGGPPAALVTMGPRTDRLPATAPGVFYVEADINGQPGAEVVLDTGAPIALLNPKAFGGAVPEGGGRVAFMTLGRTTFWKVPTVGVSEKVTLAPNGLSSGGLVGYSVFGHLMMAFDYRAENVVFGGAPVPADVTEAALIRPFALEGGGLAALPGGEVIELPPSRILVEADVEGERHTMLVDSGASWVALRQSIFDGLARDGRSQVVDRAQLASGMATTSVMRLRTVAVSGVTVEGPVAAATTQVEKLMDALSREVGHPVDGFLGAPFLREFYTVIDYPASELRLYRYPTRDHVRDEYRRVGISLGGVIGAQRTTYHVDVVYAGTDAAQQGIRPGEVLLEVDGEALDMADGVAADRTLLGPVGTQRKLRFSGRTLDVRIDELLTLP